MLWLVILIAISLQFIAVWFSIHSTLISKEPVYGWLTLSLWIMATRRSALHHCMEIWVFLTLWTRGRFRFLSLHCL